MNFNFPFFTTLRFKNITPKKTIINTPLLIDIANPYDGFNRHLNLSPFVAACLASLGFPTLLHGSTNCPPKYAITPEKILKQANLSSTLSIKEAKNQLEDPNIKLAYLDQSQFCPELHQLKKIRQDMVKRPLLATIEKFLTPIRATKTILVTGYTHPAYKQKTINLLNQINIDQYLIIRGVEGSTQPPIDKRCPIISKKESQSDQFISPTDYGLTKEEKQLPNPTITPQQTLDEGLKALQGANNTAKKIILYQSLCIIKKCNLMPVKKAHNTLVLNLKNNKALSHFQNQKKQ